MKAKIIFVVVILSLLGLACSSPDSATRVTQNEQVKEEVPPTTTNTLEPANTPTPPPTDTPEPANTPTPLPTDTSEPANTATSTTLSTNISLNNPWFYSTCGAASFDGWQSDDDFQFVTLSGKPTTPSNPDCGESNGTSPKIARQFTGKPAPPGQEIVIYQIVPGNGNLLEFATWRVRSGSVSLFEARIYGGDTKNGPWTLLWSPNLLNGSGSLVWTYVDAGHFQAPTAYPFYRVEIVTVLGDSNGNSATKVTGVHFSSTTGSPLQSATPIAASSNTLPVATLTATDTALPTNTQSPTGLPTVGPTATVAISRGAHHCGESFNNVSPALIDLGVNEYIRTDSGPTGVLGGLYADGSNEVPEPHRQAGLKAAASVQPINGKIVLASVGMSNTMSEFGQVINLAEGDPAIAPEVLLVNGARGGQDSKDWADPNSGGWNGLQKKLQQQGVGFNDVQVLWVKLARSNSNLYTWPDRKDLFKADLEQVILHANAKMPNLKMIFLSSRIYSYNWKTSQSGEPAAFEEGIAVREIILTQANGQHQSSAWLAWGPYLWANGPNPRSDGLSWLQTDLKPDCVHPRISAQEKVARQWLQFFKSSEFTEGWFVD